MEINFIIHNEEKLAEIISDKTEINNVQDALNIMADCGYNGAEKIIISRKNITEDFFDLKTGIAGEILQKFSNYRTSLVIIGDFSDLQSKSIKDFIYESNKTGRISFLNNLEQAKEKLTKR